MLPSDICIAKRLPRFACAECFATQNPIPHSSKNNDTSLLLINGIIQYSLKHYFLIYLQGLCSPILTAKIRCISITNSLI